MAIFNSKPLNYQRVLPSLFHRYYPSIEHCYPTMKFPGWCFGTWLLFSPIVGMMIQSDFHIFSEGWLNHQPVPVWRLWNHIRSKSHFIANPNLRNTIVWLVVAVTTILFVGNLQGKKGGQPVFWSWKPRNYGNYPMNFIPLLSRYYPNNHPRNY
jgi:hypothetical protein